MLRTSMRRETKDAKLSRLSGSMATSMAKQKNDPLYKRMKMFKDKYFDLKAQLRKKYGSRGKIAARRASR